MTLNVMALPGIIATHHATGRYVRPSLIMEPHDGIQEGTPTPRKLIVASATIIRAAAKLAITIMVEAQFGSKYRSRSRPGPHPRP